MGIILGLRVGAKEVGTRVGFVGFTDGLVLG